MVLNNQEIIEQIRNLRADDGLQASILADAITQQNKSNEILDVEGNTPIFLMIKYDKQILLEAFLAFNVGRFRNMDVEQLDVNKKNHDGDTPLIYAAKLNRVECFKLLVQSDVNTRTRNNQGESVYDIITNLYILPLYQGVDDINERLEIYEANMYIRILKNDGRRARRARERRAHVENEDFFGGAEFDNPDDNLDEESSDEEGSDEDEFDEEDVDGEGSDEDNFVEEINEGPRMFYENLYNQHAAAPHNNDVPPHRRVNLRRDQDNLGQAPKFKILSQYEYDAKNGTLYDPIDLGDRNNQEYLDEDEDNIIFILKEGEKYTCYGYPRSQIGTDLGAQIFYDCQRKPDGTYRLDNHGGFRDFDDNPNKTAYVKIAFTYPVFIEKNELVDVLSTDARVFFLGEPITDLTYTYSLGSFLNTIGASHCQRGSDIKVQSIYVCEQQV